MQTMSANVFHGPNDIRVEEVPRPIACRRRSSHSDNVNDHLRHRSPHSSR